MEKVINEKRSIAPVLRNMKMGDVEVFPLSQYSSVVSVKRRIHLETGIKFKFKAKDNCVILTRIA